MKAIQCGGSLVEERMVYQPSGGGSIPTPPTQFPAKAHQRLIRELHAQEPDPLIEQKIALAASLKNAWVREIDREAAKKIILKYEWLGNMGTADYYFGLYFDEHLAGAVCFFRPNRRNKHGGISLREEICRIGDDAGARSVRPLGARPCQFIFGCSCMPTHDAEGLQRFYRLRGPCGEGNRHHLSGHGLALLRNRG